MVGKEDLARHIEQTLLRPSATREEVTSFLEEARQYPFHAVMVNPTWVSLAARILEGTPILPGTAIGFPLGATLSEVKAEEARRSVALGAREVDVVINIGALKGHDDALVLSDLAGVVEAVRGVPGVDPTAITVKAILETCYLSDEEKERASRLAIEAGCDFIKTSTGFGPAGATPADVRLMSRVAAGRVRVKAAGGVATLAAALELIEAGADRLGTSKGVQILNDLA